MMELSYRSMKKKKGKSPRRQLAEKNCVDPKSGSYLNMTKSMVKAGYTQSYADSYCGELWAGINFTDILPEGVENPQVFAKKCYGVLFRLVTELEDAPKLTKVSAKYIVLIHKTLELLKDMFGMKRPEVKYTESVQYIGIPRQICRKCGSIMDYMREGEENE